MKIPEHDINGRKRRKLSPVSSIVLPSRQNLDKYESRLQAAVTSPNNLIPASATKFGISQGYRQMVHVKELGDKIPSEGLNHQAAVDLVA
ncbi:hypothetical protein [Parasitella parasitica]|uniref:Uncharacterized protein n=1 Tax=Parasitella parasitica TaxID=35722 RepID=A0A0B7NGV9_9FUNG|nr:hypothetical protein [Parasitella parasitica]